MNDSCSNAAPALAPLTPLVPRSVRGSDKTPRCARLRKKCTRIVTTPDAAALPAASGIPTAAPGPARNPCPTSAPSLPSPSRMPSSACKKKEHTSTFLDMQVDKPIGTHRQNNIVHIHHALL